MLVAIISFLLFVVSFVAILGFVMAFLASPPMAKTKEQLKSDR